MVCRVHRHRRRHPQRCSAAVAEGTNPAADTANLKDAPASEPGSRLFAWLKDHGMPEPNVMIRQVERAGQTLDVTVASRDLVAGDVAFRIPEHLVIDLGRVFEDETVAELLTTDKLSELACLTLYLMYEKKNGKQSVWYDFIKELDRQRGRGQLGAKTPLLWDDGEVERFLAGSPVVALVKERLKGVQREYQELDTVWFMAGSLFKNYPYDIPTEAFSLELFTQAFAAVQASVVHLQGVPLSKRFALVPLGPPILSYSSTSKAMLKYDPAAKEVVLVVDRDVKRGEPVYAWCGPQPNSRLLLNYGIVDDANPYDKLQLTATIPKTDRLFQLKRAALQHHNLATQQSFQLQRHQALPAMLLPYLRLANCTDADLLGRPGAFSANSGPISDENERTVLRQLTSYLQGRLKQYPTKVEQDNDIIDSPTARPRQKVAARLVRIEKNILQDAIAALMQLPGAAALSREGTDAAGSSSVKLS
ncbi:hypothetical protein WJX72_010243 [[Myrmecia] bisecta]|uniref:Rubisco LSMT substrate-binding domain-containing protein n=1 Tax=[Myrmecia] bisecta TaxID=41462 RepID=A0AAW1R9E7_9CHLO